MTIYQPLEEVIPWVVQAALLASGLLVMTGFVVRRQIAAANGGVIPDEGVTIRNVMEMVLDGLSGLARDTMGDEWRTYFPIVATLFVFVLFSNVMGLVPGVGDFLPVPFFLPSLMASLKAA